MQITNTRLDIVTRTRLPKERLLRFVIVKGGLVVDKKQSMPGRGYYLLKEENILDLAHKKHLFERLLHRGLTPDETSALLEAIHE